MLNTRYNIFNFRFNTLKKIEITNAIYLSTSILKINRKMPIVDDIIRKLDKYPWCCITFLCMDTILSILSIIYSDPNEPCQKTSIGIMITASTWLLVYGVETVVYTGLIICIIFMILYKEFISLKSTMIPSDRCFQLMTVVYIMFYIVWTIIGVIVFFGGTLTCLGKSRMFSIMMADLSFSTIIFIKCLYF